MKKRKKENKKKTKKEKKKREKKKERKKVASCHRYGNWENVESVAHLSVPSLWLCHNYPSPPVWTARQAIGHAIVVPLVNPSIANLATELIRLHFKHSLEFISNLFLLALSKEMTVLRRRLGFTFLLMQRRRSHFEKGSWMLAQK